jgi:hypothetical protein
LTCNYKGFDLGIRFDLFNNSNLLNPQDSYTDQGIGRWYIRKHLKKLDISAGYLYDQVGSGIIFRAYEERPLLIDNALYGVRLNYSIDENWLIKVFSGKQKKLFETYDSIIKGMSLDGYLSFGEESTLTLAPGFGIVSKTLSDSQMDNLANGLGTYTPEDFIDEAPYNNYAFSVFNTLSAGPVSWYIETAFKTEDVFFDLYADRTLWTGEMSSGKFVLDKGYVLYSSLSYAESGLGVVAEYKRTSNFNFRADPFASLNKGIINYLPPMMRFNTYRLTSRYTPATQDLGEQAFQVDVRYAINKNLGILINFSNITDLSSNLLYREIYSEASIKKPRKWTLLGGIQFQWYDQELYQGKTGVPMVKAITPYLEYLYKFGRKKSLRTELQYMHTKQDFGSWLFGLVEFGLVPHWSFELSNMWNIAPIKDETGKKKNDALHYPTVGVVYTNGSNRYSLRFVKQVEGVVCAGGICRLEPAFSGIKFQIISQF